MPVAKKNSELTLRDRLSRLTLAQAEKLLGPDGKQLIKEGGMFDIGPEDVHMGSEYFTACWGGANDVVTIRLDATRPDHLQVMCPGCYPDACPHAAAALSFILEEKRLLGLAKAPKEAVAEPVQLTERELIEQALAERIDRAKEERMRVQSMDTSTPWTDYTITSAASGKMYRA